MSVADAILPQIQNFRQVLQDAVDCLKPGGILTGMCQSALAITIANLPASSAVIEGILETYDTEGEVIISKFDDNPEGSAFSRLMFESFQCMNRRGGTVHAGHMLEHWLPQLDSIERWSHE
jgi:hypothetical protein